MLSLSLHLPTKSHDVVRLLHRVGQDATNGCNVFVIPEKGGLGQWLNGEPACRQIHMYVYIYIYDLYIYIDISAQIKLSQRLKIYRISLQ